MCNFCPCIKLETFCLFFRVKDTTSSLRVISLALCLMFGLQAALVTVMMVASLSFRYLYIIDTVTVPAIAAVLNIVTSVGMVLVSKGLVKRYLLTWLAWTWASFIVQGMTVGLVLSSSRSIESIWSRQAWVSQYRMIFFLIRFIK